MKTKAIDQYAFVVRPLTAEEGGGFLCEFPDVPGCMGDGETPERAIRDGRLALIAALTTLNDLGRDVPASLRGGEADEAIQPGSPRRSAPRDDGGAEIDQEAGARAPGKRRSAG